MGGNIINNLLGNKKSQFKQLEMHLRKYKQYKSAITIIKRQLDHLIPDITSTYKVSERNNATFTLHSESIDNYNVDRISGIKSLLLSEELLYYELIIYSIEEAMKELTEIEKNFIRYRYIHDESIVSVAMRLGYSEKYIFEIRKQALTKLLIPLKGLTII